MPKRLAASAVTRTRSLVKPDRRVTRVVAGSTAVATAVLGLNLVTAGPAAAATGAWRAYGNTNPITSSTSTWRCGFTTDVESNVLAQVCAIRSPNGIWVQAAVIVRNNRSSSYGVEAAADLSDFTAVHTLGRWECSRSGVAAHSWSVCFGQTFDHLLPVFSKEGGANGVHLGGSPPA